MVRLIVDSASDMPLAMQKELDILSVPLQVTVGEHHFKDWVDMTPEKLYAWLEKEPIVPVTSQPATKDWNTVLDGCRERQEDVLILTLSSGLSGTYSGAVLAVADYQDLNIEVVDARTASLGVTIIAAELAKQQAKGATLSELVALFHDLNRRIHTYVVVGNMEMLKRGGRVSATAAALGTMLNIKPILLVNQKGLLEPADKVRGWKKAKAYLLKQFEQHADPEFTFGVAHGANEKDMEELAEAMQDIYPQSSLIRMQIGAVIGSHVGPGTVGMVFFDKK